MGKEFKEEVVKVLKETDKFMVRIVKWGNGLPLLVKQEKYTTDEGENRFGKVKGLNYEDFAFIKEHLDEIEEALGSTGKEGKKDKQ